MTRRSSTIPGPGTVFLSSVQACVINAGRIYFNISESDVCTLLSFSINGIKGGSNFEHDLA
jgi:hypothetical protein